MRVILASSSPRRHELLAMIGIAHDVVPADIDESLVSGEAPIAYAERLAREKAVAVAANAGDAVVIAADTVVVVDDVVLGKPRDEQEAAEMLCLLSNRSHIVHTAVAVRHRELARSAVESPVVTFRPLETGRIDSYIATGEPMDKAGAYGIQGYGATLVSRIEGDYFAVMGLPLHRLILLLENVGVEYRFAGLRVRGVS